MAKATLTTTGVQTVSSGVKVKPASASGKAVAGGTAQAMKKIYNPPAPRDKTGQAGG